MVKPYLTSNMLIYIRFYIVAILITLWSCNEKAVNRSSGDGIQTIKLDGNIEDWPSGSFVRFLIAPWNHNQIDSTIFQTYLDENYLYFYFDTKDTSRYILPYIDEMSVADGDRVELFFSATGDLNDGYYCAEMDPQGYILDYQATFYRDFDRDWDFKTLETATDISDDRYLVEGRVALSELEELGMQETFYLGIYRADFKGKDDVVWYSWNIPDSDTPDFHIPSSLKMVSLKNKNGDSKSLTPVISNQQSYYNKGVLIYPENIELAPMWPLWAKQAGINTIGVHPGGGHLRNTLIKSQLFMESAAGQEFLKKCDSLDIQVEYEVHGIEELLPRDLFNENPEMFRMDTMGVRRNDYNFCPHSQEALEIIADNAIEYSRICKPTTGRYFFWTDDARPMCHCDLCSQYSDSEKALIYENYLIGQLRKFDPRATLAHLAFAGTIEAPDTSKVKPAEGIFLEFAPIGRNFTQPYYEQEEIVDNYRHLIENLKVFPVHTAQISDYWLNVAKFSGRKKPYKKMPWSKEVFHQDVSFYNRLGINHFTTFAGGIDMDYVKDHGHPPLEDYGNILNKLLP